MKSTRQNRNRGQVQMIKCYERKDRLWISGKKDSPYAEIIMPIGEKEIFIQNDQAECSNTDDIFLNNKALKKKHLRLKKVPESA